MRTTKRITCSIFLVFAILGLFCTSAVFAEEPQPEITEFAALDENAAEQTFSYDTTVEEIIATLPEIISGTVDGVEKAEIVVDNWQCKGDYDPSVNGPYEFSPVCGGYTINTSEMPTIKIYLVSALQDQINKATGTREKPTEISLNASLQVDDSVVIGYYNGESNPTDPRHIALKGSDGIEIKASEILDNSLVYVHYNSTLVIENLTLTGKEETVRELLFVVDGAKLVVGEKCLLRDNNDSAIVNHGATEILSEAVVENCKATEGAGLYNGKEGMMIINDGAIIRNCISLKNKQGQEGAGGAIYNMGTLRMDGGTIQDCQASNGSAIFIEAGIVAMENVTVKNCDAVYNGTVLIMTNSSDDQDVKIKSCHFENNTAENGGVIFGNYNTQCTITGSIFTKNRAYASGGAIYSTGKLELNSNVFENNTAGEFGGAVAVIDSVDDYNLFPSDECDVPSFAMNGEKINRNVAGGNGGGLALISNWESGDIRESITGHIEGVTFSGNTSGNAASGDVYQYANEFGGVRVNIKDTTADTVLLSKNLEAAESTWTVGSGVKIGGNSLTLAQGQPLQIASALTQNISIKSLFASQDTMNSEVDLTAFKVGDVLVQAAQGYTLTQADLDHIVTDVPLELKDGKIVVAQKINPTPTPTPVPSPTPKPVPSTGDQTPINILFVLAGVSLCLVAVMFILRRRKIK